MLHYLWSSVFYCRLGWLALLLWLLRPAGSQAQTPLGQPSLDEAKVQIWCATARYVYDDAGRPQLKRTLRCDGGSLAALAASLRPDSLRIYSLLYAPIEEKGRIYKGLKDNSARLAALSKAIIGKLRSSPARQRDPTRLANLQGLEKKLTDYVQTGLPPTDPTPAPQAEADASSLAGPAEAAEASGAGGTGEAPTMRPIASTEPLLDRLFAPLALIFSLLSLALFVLLRRSLNRTLREVRRATASQELTATQRRQVEELVTQRLADMQQASPPEGQPN